MGTSEVDSRRSMVAHHGMVRKRLGWQGEAPARQFGMSIHFDDKFRLIRGFVEQVMPAFRGSG